MLLRMLVNRSSLSVPIQMEVGNLSGQPVGRIITNSFENVHNFLLQGTELHKCSKVRV